MIKDFHPNSIIRSTIANLTPYTPIVPFDILSQQLDCEPEDIVKLDANENPYGPSPLVTKALAKLRYTHIYPDPESRQLRAALADYTGIGPEYLLVGHGADELIDLIMRLFIEPGDTIINCPPTFGMYAFDGDVNGAQVINVWRYADFSIDIDKVEALFAPPLTGATYEAGLHTHRMKPDSKGSRGARERGRRGATFHLQEQGGGKESPIQNPKSKIQNGFIGEEEGIQEQAPKLIFATSPNNPDGSLLDDETLKRLLALPAIIVLDEAYIEFSGGSRIDWVKKYNNLIILRTFSKWAGLAGLRVGYGVFPLTIIEHLWKIKQPYNVNLAGQIAARVSLADRKRLLDKVLQLIAQREKFYKALAQVSWLKPYPSQTNFVLCQVKERQASDVKKNLAEQGILVRYYNSPRLTDHIRISIGTPDQMARLEKSLKAL